MKAVLVGGIQDDKIYYIIDAKGTSNDGAIISPEGEVIMFRFFSWVSKNPGVRKIRNTKFHRLLWDNPSDSAKSKWFDVFMQKTQEIDKSMLADVIVKTDLSPSGKAFKKKNDQIKRFLSTKGQSMVIPSKNTHFTDDDKRKMWVIAKLFGGNGVDNG